MIDTSRLLPTLQLTGLAHKNQPLYQLLNQLIGIETKIAAIINATGGIGPVGPSGAQGQQGIPGNLFTLEEDIINFPIVTSVFWQSAVNGIYYSARFVGIGSEPLSNVDLYIYRDSTGFSGTVPAVKLIVKNPSTEVAANVGAVIDALNSTSTLELAMHGTGQTGTRMGINFANLAELISAGASALSILTNDATAPIYFGIGAPAAPHMTLDTTGFLGIGTKTPGCALEIKMASAALRINDTTTSVPIIYLQDNGTTVFSFQGLAGDSYFTGIVGHDSIFRPDGTERVRFLHGGNVGIGKTAPSAVLHLKAGTATANTAPIKLDSGTLLTTPEAGTIEFDGTDFFLTA